jgi:hypothetical protein
MAINIGKYVSVTSGVGAATIVPERELIGRVFTENHLIPTQSNPLEFFNAASVGQYFGFTSEEYLRSVFYFGWVSKNITSPSELSFARYINVNQAPEIYGNVQTQSLTAWQAISAGSFGLTLGGTAQAFTGLNFTAVTSLSDVAGVLQTAIRTVTGLQWTGAVVTWDSTRGAFNFVGGDASTPATVTVQAGTAGTHIESIIGWSTGAILSNGSLLETPDASVARSANASNNFGSLIFMPSLTQDQIVAVASYVESLNVMFQYYIPCTQSNYAALSTALTAIGSNGLVLSEVSGEYPEMAPMMIMAATDYSQPNSVQNYMFQQFALTAGVTTDALSASLDAARVNYYGQTQTAGQLLSFFQRGVLNGIATDPLDMNTYANEQWLKDAAEAAVMTLLLALAKVSANAQGRSQILSTLQTVVSQALLNGTISVGKILTNTQKLYVGQITNDPNAWYQVQNNGYWLDVVIEQQVDLTYQATYKLVYSKDDDIRKVEGTHVLI